MFSGIKCFRVRLGSVQEVQGGFVGRERVEGVTGHVDVDTQMVNRPRINVHFTCISVGQGTGVERSTV